MPDAKRCPLKPGRVCPADCEGVTFLLPSGGALVATTTGPYDCDSGTARVLYERRDPPPSRSFHA
jgi:hypothetical protein